MTCYVMLYNTRYVYVISHKLCYIIHMLCYVTHDYVMLYNT